MISLTEGSAVTCGICNRETTVKFATERIGGTAYDLNCQHRNAYCEKCDILVADRSDDPPIEAHSLVDHLPGKSTIFDEIVVKLIDVDGSSFYRKAGVRQLDAPQKRGASPASTQSNLAIQVGWTTGVVNQAERSQRS